MANKNPNLDNLDKEGRFQNLSASEVRAIASKGGKARMKAHKRKQTFKEAFGVIEDYVIKEESKKLNNQDKAELAKVLQEGGWLFYELMKIVRSDGDNKLSAIKEILDRVHGKPIQTTLVADEEKLYKAVTFTNEGKADGVIKLK